jgi:glucosamine 6-phosphate synthetase-like amidotransferase/phosphosugar isomerase protein
LFTTLGTLTEVRGVHATGFYGLNSEVIFDKDPGPATRFYQKRNFVNQHKESAPDVLIGHNRWATHGDPKDNINNHPFISDRFGFIHNGIVASVKVPIPIKTYSECDSEMMFAYFKKLFWNNHNVARSLVRTMEAFDSGWYGCALVDNKERTLYLFGNREDIVYTHLRDFNIIVFAATHEILNRAMRSENLRFTDSIHTVYNGKLLKFNTNLTIEKYKDEKKKLSFSHWE